ncbi:MAG TPA: SRPBCC family protein [Thermoanaerobaculia bacterium]|jgi:uncharacterized protein YndB with AHSA1/START domain|nr:SRPBCC family protein [Thermoanaerobaculia bacterium]
MTIKGTHEITISTPPDEVWRVLEDSTLLPAWVPMVKHTTGLRETAGSTRTCEVEWNGRRDEVSERCTEATRNERIAWALERGMLLKMFSKVSFAFVLKKEQSEATRVTMEYSYEPRNFITSLLFRVMMARKMATMRRGLLANLRRVVEERLGQSEFGIDEFANTRGSAERQSQRAIMALQVETKIEKRTAAGFQRDPLSDLSE